MEKMRKKIRLDKFLSDSTSYSRKDATSLIRKGSVKVNGKTVSDGAFKVDTLNDEVTLNGEKLHYKENYYIMMNKPAGYLSATEDSFQKTVLDLLSDDLPKSKIFPAGRLDKDTEGFLFLTTDGLLAHLVTGPKNHVEKTYYVEVNDTLKKDFIEIFKNGITLNDMGKEELCKSARLEILSETTCHLTITEGKYHQVKRMFEAVGRTVLYLKRLSIGKVTLDEKLVLGQYREMTEEEVINICMKK